MKNLRIILEEYILHVSNDSLLGKSTKKSYINTVSQFINFWGSYKLIVTLSEKCFSTYVNYLNNNHYNYKSINTKTSALNNFIDYLNSNYNLKINTISTYLTVPEKEKSIRILSDKEICSFKSLVDKDLRSLVIIDLLLFSGIKVGEIPNLKICQFQLLDEKQGILHLENRDICLTGDALTSLLKFLAVNGRGNSDYLLSTNSGKCLDIRNIRRQIDRYLKKAGFKNVTLFDLRHTFCVNFLKKGLPIQDLAQIADHKNLITTQKYLIFLKKEKP